MQLTSSLSGNGLNQFARISGALANSSRPMLAAALNRAAGQLVRANTIAAETAQTGLSKSTIKRAQKEELATAGSLTYLIRTHGGNISLKYFHPKETGGGVTASPWGSQRYFARAFLMGGRLGARKPLPKLNGHVFMREGRKQLGINKVKSGLFIPTELLRGQTRASFDRGGKLAAGYVLDQIASASGFSRPRS